MGIVKKQAYKNTFLSYGGMVVAYINTVLLFPFFTTPAEYGFYQLVVSLSVMYSLLSSMGVPSIIAKYFPFYRTDDNRHNGFMHLVAGFSAIGFAAATFIYIIFKPVILGAYHNSVFFERYYYYMIPLSFFIVAFNYLEMTGRVIYQTIYSNFLQNILLRLLTTGALVMIALHWISFRDFIFIYIAANGLISLLLLISIMASGKFDLRLTDRRFSKISKKELVSFGTFILISGTVYVLLQKVDTLMLSSIAGDDVQGVYSWYFNIAILISVPAQALGRTTYPIVADAWRSNNLPVIAQLYAKTSIIQMIFGCLLFIGIIINRENLYAIAHNKDFTDPKYFSLFLVIGLGFLVDITGGLNTYILTTSHKYKLVTIVVLVASVFCVGLNYILIPKYKGMGAAISYLLAISGVNFFTWFYIKIRFKMQPFTYKHLLVIGISLVSLVVGKFFWRMPNFYFDVLVRSGVTSIIYLAFTYYLKVSKDLNEKIDEVLAKIKALLGL
ncbi:O-antigen/teichoic acid export membrane protein [Mucilaginibacter oryzae]|uniref:O-antigen/teichoic acid export membrane protein n=1 Tax=Mucilaginibacter oryzae TaxID=468058 RepID=A0A316H1G0_9SPHI|nr:polysaccharide biosynthesis C-terminal domain-containing protein [Mucilaginibacter oryzae]PWK71422.1 O-antigen/teichoic acid export membrane protein [Mucilaginibacter oryzae]